MNGVLCIKLKISETLVVEVGTERILISLHELHKDRLVIFGKNKSKIYRIKENFDVVCNNGNPDEEQMEKYSSMYGNGTEGEGVPGNLQDNGQERAYPASEGMESEKEKDGAE